MVDTENFREVIYQHFQDTGLLDSIKVIFIIKVKCKRKTVILSC